jgi:hypothetical protein
MTNVIKMPLQPFEHVTLWTDDGARLTPRPPPPTMCLSMTAGPRIQETFARSPLSGRPVGRDALALGILDLLLLAR